MTYIQKEIKRLGVRLWDGQLVSAGDSVILDARQFQPYGFIWYVEVDGPVNISVEGSIDSKKWRNIGTISFSAAGYTTVDFTDWRGRWLYYRFTVDATITITLEVSG